MEQQKPKVLLVDDVDFFRDVMRDYFKRTPADIFMAANGEEAISMAMREWPDLIYMDVAMPGMSGIEVCKKLKAHERLSKIPVLLIFTPDRDAKIEEVEKSGCDGYLTKPFGREEFLNLGHRHLFNIERRERRVQCQMTINFTINGVNYQGRGIDLSMHGLYVEFRDEIPPNSRIEASFLLPTISPKPVKCRGKIAWVNQGFPRTNLTVPQGFGIEIQSIDMDSVDTIRSFLDKN
ncbi:MAG: response regulator [Desulfuromonadales bacterium]|nr:response regulator [Desulfuromonadales bacterium]